MKIVRLLAAALLVGTMPVVASAAPHEGCSGFTFDDGGGDGSADLITFNGFDCGFKIIGSDTGSFDEVASVVSAVAEENLYVSGEWFYKSKDVDGPMFDTFGFFVEGEEMQLSDDDGANAQEGLFGFLVGKGETFGWFVTAADDFGGPGKAAVRADFKIPAVPLPASALLMIGGLAGLVALRRKLA